jgi:4-deoxy-L-threo-5-hexosulose-uronate ketol-isomerase
MVMGGALPGNLPLRLEPAGPIKADHFLEARELGILKVGGGPGSIIVEGVTHQLEDYDSLYVGMGNRSVQFTSSDPGAPARFYWVSTTAHRSCPTRLIKRSDVSPVELGADGDANRRVLYKAIEGDVDTCQLVMGFTIMEPGHVWNTMPPHLHDRRSEIYFYFGLPEAARVIHLMGQPDQTRHLLVGNEQAVISPRWSIHAGVGTTSYSFCWAMAGENRTYADIDKVGIEELR